jgi:hypothetical protein
LDAKRIDVDFVEGGNGADVFFVSRGAGGGAGGGVGGGVGGEGVEGVAAYFDNGLDTFPQ